MLKLPVTYTDYNGDKVTDIFYFNLSERELIQMDVEYEKGFESFINKIVETTDKKELITLFQKLIMMSYGIKSDDGKRFIKTEEVKIEFSQTEAYNVLFMRLATDDKEAANFLKGIMPPNMAAAIEQAVVTTVTP